MSRGGGREIAGRSTTRKAWKPLVCPSELQGFQQRTGKIWEETRRILLFDSLQVLGGASSQVRATNILQTLETAFSSVCDCCIIQVPQKRSKLLNEFHVPGFELKI